ncbi:hypothetical protein SAMN05444339_101162 [Loktanella atrilutea]|uniref:EamA domain-containing protein n=2 Tax=Loktanella atrilutea TaxID=366533 RepID=A0A1M4SWA2_LOKAT|nr:hypothetical protein SAMN05444339_101162 [Loktanella atrilutea]
MQTCRGPKAPGGPWGASDAAMIWVWVTLGAVAAQTVRFMLQKQLRAATLSTAGATFARFIYSAPLVALLAFTYAVLTGQATAVPARFWAFAMAGGFAQIIATMCVVALFTQRNFAVGLTFMKTEVLMAALLSIVLLGEQLPPLAWIALVLGLPGIVLLSDAPAASGPWYRRIVNRGSGLGLASGVLFAVSSVGYRGASTALPAGDAFFRAILTLACVTAFQVVAMTLWLVWREPGQITRVVRAWRIAGLVGLTSMAGSTCWFVAFTLQTVALVKGVGQIELALSLMVGWAVFGERITGREAKGLVLLTLSVMMLVWAD